MCSSLVTVSEGFSLGSKGALDLGHLLAVGSQQSVGLLLHSLQDQVRLLCLLLQVLDILVILGLELLWCQGCVHVQLYLSPWNFFPQKNNTLGLNKIGKGNPLFNNMVF